MKLLGWFLMLCVVPIAYGGQAYTLPRVGLHALTPGQYGVFCLFSAAGIALLTVGQMLAGIDGDN